MLKDATSVLSFIWNHPSNRKRRLAALLRAARWQVYKRALGGYRDISLTGDRIIRCYPDSTSASSVLYAGLFDFDVMHFLLRYLRPDDNFLDVGANIGVYTILASSIVTRGRIHAFEPGQPSLHRLKENIRLNRLQNVRVHPLAVAESNCKLPFTDGLDTVNHVLRASGTEHCFSVRAASLDSLVKDVAFTLGKMDIEGYELPALRGANQMLREKNPPVWVIEVSEASCRYGYDMRDLVMFMQRFGYSMFRYLPEEVALRPEDRPWESIKNVLFLSGQQREVVEYRLQNLPDGS